MKRQLLCITLLLLIAHSASAWDGVVEGRVGVIELSGGGNYDFRVWLEGGPVMCGNQSRWAYINESDANYKTYVAVLLSAKQAGTLVQISANRDSSGYCKIGHMVAYSY